MTAAVYLVVPSVGSWWAGVQFCMVFLGMLVAMRASAMQLDDLEQLASEAVQHALQHAHLCIKEAAALMGLDESNLRKQLKREPGNHLSFFRMFRLPFMFWMHLAPEIVKLAAKKRLAEISADLKVQR